MRVRDHIALSTAGSALLSRWFGRGVISIWAGAVLIDVDHYVWFCLRERRLNPMSAVRYFNGAYTPPRAASIVRELCSRFFCVALVGRSCSLSPWAWACTSGWTDSTKPA